MINQKNSEIKSLITDADTTKMKLLRDYFNGSGIKISKSMSKKDINDLAAYISRQSTSKEWRTGLNDISEDLRKAGNALAKYLDGQVEAPSGAKERDFIRAVFKQALDRLNSDPAITKVSNTGLTMSDLQALLWYPEKRLYDTAKAKEGEESKGYADDEAPDYANAARKLVQTRSAMVGRGGLGSPGANGPGGRTAGSTDARPALAPITEGVAGGLAQRLNAGGLPAVTSPPSTQDVKQAAKQIRSVIEIGKKGGEFEDGIKDIAGVRKLADAINVGLVLYDSVNELLAGMNYPKGSSETMGLYSEGVAAALNAGVEDLSEFQSYIIALHEVAHGLNDQVNNPGYISKFSPEQQPAVEGVLSSVTMQSNKLTKNSDYVRRYSFDALIGSMLSNTDNIPKHLKKQVLKEIKQLQDFGTYKDGSDVRYIGGSKLRIGQRKKLPYYKYIRSASEFAVDPILYYFHDPKGMKQKYPATASMIQAFFHKSTKVQFFSHPLAMAFAVALAMLMKADQEDDERKKQQAAMMPPGALNAPMAPGMLSQA
jgi:hypothetical protein